jgi:hypothetical protein
VQQGSLEKGEVQAKRRHYCYASHHHWFRTCIEGLCVLAVSSSASSKRTPGHTQATSRFPGGRPRLVAGMQHWREENDVRGEKWGCEWEYERKYMGMH